MFNLGIFYALALQSKGWKTSVIERNKVEGREQEWNISKKELAALVRLGIMTGIQEKIQLLVVVIFKI